MYQWDIMIMQHQILSTFRPSLNLQNSTDQASQYVFKKGKCLTNICFVWIYSLLNKQLWPVTLLFINTDTDAQWWWTPWAVRGSLFIKCQLVLHKAQKTPSSCSIRAMILLLKETVAEHFRASRTLNGLCQVFIFRLSVVTQKTFSLPKILQSWAGGSETGIKWFNNSLMCNVHRCNQLKYNSTATYKPSIYCKHTFQVSLWH